MHTAALEGMSPEPVHLLRAGEAFSHAELQCLARDALVFPVGTTAWAPFCTPMEPRLRAKALALSLPGALRQRFVVARLSAAWIHGCAAEPPLPYLLADIGHRMGRARTMTQAIWLVSHLEESDIASHGGVLVTTPLRTAADLMLYPGPDSALNALRALVAGAGVEQDALLDRLSRLTTTPRWRQLRQELPVLLRGGGEAQRRCEPPEVR